MKKTNKLISILLVMAMLLSMAPLSLTASAALTPTATGGCDGNHSGYTALSQSGWSLKITQPGNYYINKDWAMETYEPTLVIECSGTVTLCLNGYDLYHTGNSSRVVYIYATGGDLTVNLCDCKGTGEIYHNNKQTGIDLFGVESNGYYATLNMYGGTIRDCSSGISETSNTRFNMYGGTIKGCSYYGVFQSSYDGKVNIYGGSIINNNEGIRVCSADAVTLTGSPVINGNTNGDLYFRQNNSPVIAKNLSVSEKITIAQYTAKDCAVVKVDSEEAYDYFEALDPTARTISHNDNTIWFHGDHLWKDANCTEPKTCQSCGMTEGEALGHDWKEATCTAPETCSVCEETQGEVVSHAFNTYTKSAEAKCEVNAKETASCDYGCGTTDTRDIEGTALTHSFTYSASGNTITAECANGENCPNPQRTLTISAPADLYVDGTAKEATIENNLVDTSVAISDITYSAPYGLPPKDAGTYTASVTVGGATATVEFTLLNYAAMVTDKDGNELSDSPYKTLADAITAASASEGSTVTLLDDITLTTRQDIRSGTFTLDLNGNNLVNETDSVFYIYEEVDLTIKDSGEGGTIETKRMYVDCIDNSGKLTVESGIIKGDGGIRNYGVLYFNDGTVETDYYPAITNYSDSTVYIYDGVLKSSNSGAVENGGTLYVYGGEIDGFFNVGTAYISGGKIDRDDYVALHLLGGTVEVTGGSFTGTDFSNGYYSGTPYGEWTVDIDEGATLILKGGEFPNGFVVDETTANTFLAEDYYYKDADGKLITVSDDAKVINGYVKVSKGADLADAVITLDETQFTYSGVEHKPTVIVTVGGKTLTEGKDYTLTFANNVNAGTATVTIKAIGQAAGGIAGGGENIGNSSNSGDITESVYTGEVTKEFTINKKPVTVTATAPDKVYDGTKDIDYDTIVITFDGIVEGDTVGYTIKEAWFNGIVVGTDWSVPIVYNVTGEDANNYTFPAGGEYIAPDYFVEATADITAKDISDGFIILGAPLTYNGKEQTQTVEKVIPTGTAPEATYTVSGNKATNVGVYLLTVTGTGNFSGEAKIAYEIALDDECISHLDRVEDNGVMKWNVKSTDRESLEYVIDQLNNAVTDIADEDKKNEWADTKEACEDMLRIINSIELAIADVEEDYAGFSEDTVKSSDIPALDEIVSKVNEIKDRYGFNLTDEEAKKLEDILDGIEKLKAKIAETAEEIERIDEAVNGYDKETVTSDDVPELGKLIEDINALTDGDNLTEDERAALEEADKAIDDLVEKLTEVAEEIKRVDEAVKSYDEDSVKSTDSEDLAQLKEDIQALIDSGNTTEIEKTALEDMIKDIEGLEDKIAETEEKLEEIKGIENNFNPETVTSDDKAAIEDAIAEIEAVNPDNLTDEQKAEYDEIKAEFEALLEEIAAAEKAVEDIVIELEMFEENRVTIFWEDDIEALKAKIDELLADENMGEAEKVKLNEYKAQCDKLIEIIHTPVEYFSLRLFYFVWDALNWLVNHVVFIFNWIF